MRAEIHAVMLAVVALSAGVEVVDALEVRVDVAVREAAADRSVEPNRHEVCGQAQFLCRELRP